MASSSESPETKNSLEAFLESRADLNLKDKVVITGNPVGHGGFGDVYTGNYKLPDGMECKVAVKKLRAKTACVRER